MPNRRPAATTCLPSRGNAKLPLQLLADDFVLARDPHDARATVVLGTDLECKLAPNHLSSAPRRGDASASHSSSSLPDVGGVKGRAATAEGRLPLTPPASGSTRPLRATTAARTPPAPPPPRTSPCPMFQVRALAGTVASDNWERRLFKSSKWERQAKCREEATTY